MPVVVSSPAWALRVGGRLGRSMPAHCTSTGKALLARLSDDDVRRLYPDEQLVQLTPRSIGSRTELLATLAQVRAQGYAESSEESEDGVSSLAVALHAVRSPRLAVNVSVPASRMSPDTRTAVLGRPRGGRGTRPPVAVGPAAVAGHLSKGRPRP